MRRFGIFNLLGVGFLIAAIYLGYCAVTDYAADVGRQSWTETTAVVTDIGSREIRRSRGKHSSRYETVYDIAYAYQVDGVDYTGQISGTSNYRVHGETVRVKYDPAAPQNSTATLAPSLYNLIVPLIAAAVFGLIGFFASGLWALFRRKREPEEPEPMEAYLEEPPVISDAVPKDAGGLIRHFLKGIVILVVFIAVMVGFVMFILSLGDKKEPVTADAVQRILTDRGYTTADVTQQYSESWQMELDRALVVETEEMVFLFIEMPDVDTAQDVLNGLYSYSLATVSRDADVEYKYTGNNFLVHTMEADGQYSMHIRVEDTVAYVQCSESSAAEAVAILDEIAYFN